MGKHQQHLLLLLAAAAIASCQDGVHSRIVGGANGDITDYPWQVSLTYQHLPACGGSIISPFWVLTACHCFPDEHPLGDYDVVAGITSLDQTDGAQVRLIERVIKNPMYNPNSYSYDVALVKLKAPLEFGSTVNRIKLPAASVQIPPGMGCTITGWGNIRHSDALPSPKTLQVGRVIVISRRTCNCLHHIDATEDSLTTIQPDMMCAGDVHGSVDACQGDSGGPLSCYTNNNWYQVGVVSWGDKCGEPNRPGAYIALVAVVDWIKQNDPNAEVQDFTVDITPTPDDENGCKAADGKVYSYPNKGTTLMVTFISLPLYWLTTYLLTNL